MSLTGQQFYNHVGTFWLEKWLSKLIMVLFPLTSQWLWSTSPSFIIYCLTSDDLGNKQGSWLTNLSSWYSRWHPKISNIPRENWPLLTLNAPIATKVICFSRLLKCLRSLYGKQCGPRSDCSYRSRLFWVHPVCFYTQFVSNVRQLFAADDFSRQHFQMHFFSWCFKG